MFLVRAVSEYLDPFYDTNCAQASVVLARLFDVTGTYTTRSSNRLCRAAGFAGAGETKLSGSAFPQPTEALG
eukprot:4926548-Prymnesium_polylepis.1